MLPEIKSIISSDQIKIQEKLAISLAFIAGYLDAVGIIKWKTYVSFMSGNTTQLGIAFSNTKSVTIITSITVIGCFVLGIYTGTCLSLWKNCKMKTLPFYIVSGILIAYTTASYFYNITIILSIAIIGFSTGIMNTIVTSVGNQNINTDFVTGTLTSLARNTAMLSMTNDKTDKKQYKINAIHLLLLWIGFLSGAFVAPFLPPSLGNLTLGLPGLLVLICGLLLSFTSLDSKI